MSRTNGAEYGETAVPIEDALESVSTGDTPAVVWVYDPEDEKLNENCSNTIFQNEGIGLALKKFRTLRVDVKTITSERIREQYDRTPAFHFYDPKGELLGKVEGKASASLSKFSSLVNASWNRCFTVRLKDYQKQMTKILDRLDRYDGQKQILDRDLAKLAEKPNPRKKRQLEKEAAELEELAKEIAEDEQGVLTGVELREEYLSEKEGEKVARK
jgi:hypothetical protein